MSIIENLLDDVGVDPDEIIEENDRSRANRTVGRNHSISIDDVPLPTEFPTNPFLDEAQTSKGGLFANLGSDIVVLEEGTKMSEFPTGDGGTFGLDGQFMQPIYMNTTDEAISIDVESREFVPTNLSLDVDPYNQSEFAANNQWTRIPTGFGTPYPISGSSTAWDDDGNFQGDPISGGPDGNYELVEISETEGGFKVIWEYLGDEEQMETTSAGLASSGVNNSSEDAKDQISPDPEDDADALI